MLGVPSTQPVVSVASAHPYEAAPIDYLRIPSTVVDLHRMLEIEERGLCLPTPSSKFWPMSSAAMGATVLDSPHRQLPPLIATLVFRFLDRASANALRRVSPHFHHQWGDSRLFPPSPSCYSCRQYGFGKASPLLSTAHSSLSPYFLIHLAWDWLSVTDRRSLASAMPTMANYATLRVAATHLDLSSLQASRLHRMLRRSAKTEHIAWPRPSFALILTTETSSVDSVLTSSVTPGYPAFDFDCAIRLATEGAPLAGHFECSFAAVQQHERHNNASLTR